jgi:quercetin dioxygenase-like cupin family protein
MSDTTGDSIVARGEHVALRVWRNEAPNADKPEETRPYETLGYVVSGRLELTVNGRTTSVGAGESYTVPQNAPHRYIIREELTAVEAISPAR